MRKNFFALDIGGTTMKGAAVSPSGKFGKISVIDTDAQKGPAVILENIRKISRQILAENGGKKNFIAAGAGIPGIVNEKGEVACGPNFPGWKTVNVKKVIAAATGLTTYLDNDANCAGIAELVFGAGKKLKHFTVFTLGTGVGGALILDGKLYRGSRSGAGEIGHIPVEVDGWLRNDGVPGGIEQYAGIGGILKIAAEEMKKPAAKNTMLKSFGNKLTPKDIADCAKKGDACSQLIFDRTAKYLGTAIAAVVNTLNPQAVILAGGISGAGDVLMKPLLKEAMHRSKKPLDEHYKILISPLGKDAGLLGAAALAIDGWKRR